MQTLINIAVAVLAAYMGAILLGGDPISHPLEFAGFAAFTWLVIDKLEVLRC